MPCRCFNLAPTLYILILSVRPKLGFSCSVLLPAAKYTPSVAATIPQFSHIYVYTRSISLSFEDLYSVVYLLQIHCLILDEKPCLGNEPLFCRIHTASPNFFRSYAPRRLFLSGSFQMECTLSTSAAQNMKFRDRVRERLRWLRRQFPCSSKHAKNDSSPRTHLVIPAIVTR